LSTSKTKQIFIGHKSPVWALNYGILKNSSYMVSGGQDKNIILWNIQSGEEILRLNEEVTQSTIMTIGVDNKKGIISFAGSSGVINIWDIFKEEQYLQLEGHVGCVTCLIHSENYIYSTGFDKKLIKWDLETGKMIKEMKNTNSGLISTMRLLKESNKLFIATSDKIKCYDCETFQLLNEYIGHSSLITCLSYIKTSLLKPLLISCSRDKTIRIWDEEKGKKYYLFGPKKGKN
jgi:WD40 repeat protein